MMTLAMILRRPVGWENDSALEHHHLILAYAAVFVIQISYAGWVMLQRSRLK